nr:Tm-1-like ATP-binding domain-containing protein [uncultured Arsenicibacter sp.]
MSQSILIVGCFDTKGEVFAYLRQCILDRGETVCTINTGVLGTTTLFPVDYEADVVARQVHESLAGLRDSGDRGRAIDIMGQGAAALVRQLVDANQVKAIIGMGGGGGTFIALSAMQPVPFGIPKLCLSTLAAKDISAQVGSKDIALMTSVVDVAGLNSISLTLIARAAAGICAMAAVPVSKQTSHKGRIAVSMFGNTTPCVNLCTGMLEQQGFEVFAFHANGTGGRTMESLIADGFFDAVLDITTTELADELCGGICSAGPDRLQAATRLGIPQVVVPGCLDMVNFGAADTVPARFRDRLLYSWSPVVTLMRTNEAENSTLGRQLTDVLNQSPGPVTVLLPAGGLSQLDAQGGLFFRPDVNQVLFDTIETHAAETVQVIKTAANINDPAFADLVVASLLNIVPNRPE